MTHPISILSQAAQEITTAGNFDQHIPVIGEDEVARLAGAFNQMTASLRQYSAHMEEMVEERTRELQATQERLVRQERLAVLGELAGGVGHELRNPLGVISNAVYYLNMVMPEAEGSVREYLGLIDANTKEATRIVADLLDFARVKSGERSAVNVVEMVKEVLAQCTPHENVTTQVAVAEGLPLVWVESSPD